uniref:Desmoplakin SH3 domain-containing protein n=1 Tax=Petromyzon marinus TaxID=7757 RepID=S4R9D8_PETMA
QVHIENIRWGDSKATVESQFQSHTDLHNMIEVIGERVEEAKLLEKKAEMCSNEEYMQLISDISTSYMKDVSKLNDFVGRATAELIWLNQHEEREIAYDWSDHSLPNLAAKKDSHSELLKEMERKEITINRIQGLGNQMLQNNHPAVDSIEAFMGALQTQWSWLLQLRQCIEVHLQENTTYQQFFSDAKEAELFLKRQHEVIRQKYTCDKHASLEHVEQLLQNLAEERDSYMNYRQTVANVAGRAKTIVQLKPRHPDHPVHSALPIKALCEYKLDEMMIAPGDQCIHTDYLSRWYM